MRRRRVVFECDTACPLATSDTAPPPARVSGDAAPRNVASHAPQLQQRAAAFGDNPEGVCVER